MIASAQEKRRLRRVILEILQRNAEAQAPRLNDVTLTGVLDRLKFDVSVNLVRSLLQDMAERELLGFEEHKDRETGTLSIRRIRILPRGRDVLEGTKNEPSVDMD